MDSLSINIKYFNPTPIEGFKNFKHFCFKRGLGIPRPHNVLIPSLMIALNMGFKSIYILGADHSWLSEIKVNNYNQILFSQKHFYNPNNKTEKPLIHFSGIQRKLHELLQVFVWAFSGYFVVNEFAISIGAKILNATPDSYIDAFNRVDLSIIKQK